MKILKELLGLTNPDMVFEAEVPVELSDVVSAFPKHHEKAFSKLWGGKRLVWHGKRFFDDGELGAAYIEAEKAAEEYINNGYNTDANLDITAEFGSGGDPGEDDEGDEGTSHSGTDTVSWDVEFGDAQNGSRQECYLGFDPQRDVLYIGFDAWVDEAAFNEAFDEVFKELVGEEYNYENEQHAAVHEVAYKEYQNDGFGFWGIVFEISFEDGVMVAEEALPPMPGGFYKGTYKLFKQNHKNVIDLRLD